MIHEDLELPNQPETSSFRLMKRQRSGDFQFHLEHGLGASSFSSNVVCLVATQLSALKHDDSELGEFFVTFIVTLTNQWTKKTPKKWRDFENRRLTQNSPLQVYLYAEPSQRPPNQVSWQIKKCHRSFAIKGCGHM